MSAADVLRDAAIKLEEIDIKASLSLMEMALKERPDGPFIRKRINYYKRLMAWECTDLVAIPRLIKSGEIAIIPIGFRCYTKVLLNKEFGVNQPSLPFDSGFFPPKSVVNVLSSGAINLNYHDDNISHRVCIKTEGELDCDGKAFVSFRNSSYSEIEELVNKSDYSSVNRYLDSTYGYYTVDLANKYVLAHYNWHRLSSEINNKGVTDPVKNLASINSIINKRLSRMQEMCQKAKKVLFLYYNPGNIEYMNVCGERLSLTDLTELRSALIEKYGDKANVVYTSEARHMKDALLNFISK